MATQQLNSFQNVRDFFDKFVSDNQISLGGSPHLAFWNSLDYDPFVDGNVPGVDPPVKILVKGHADQSNLVAILKGPLTVGGQTIARMPEGGPYMTADMIAALADWIDRNCPNATSASGKGSSAGPA